MDNTALQKRSTAYWHLVRHDALTHKGFCRERLSIGMADVLHISYELRVGAMIWRCGHGMNRSRRPWPIRQLIENSVGWAKERLETGKIADGLKMLERCFQMQQADQVVEGVFRAFRKRFADAYAQEAAKYGQWWAESLSFGSRKAIRTTASDGYCHRKGGHGPAGRSRLRSRACARSNRGNRPHGQQSS